MSETPIQSFYKNQTIFLTGATGFLGKVLLEKLLRSTQIRLIYVFIRSKRNKSLKRRLEELFQSHLFDKLKGEKPDFRSRVTPISGDCTAENLGISGRDAEILISEVNIVFHSAASVRFDEHLQDAFQINFKATEAVLKLCQDMTQLKAFIYISTAYTNTPLNEIDELVYKCHLNYEKLQKMFEKFDRNEIERLSPRLKGQHQNTYTLTKAMTEEMLKDKGGPLPIGIFRPAIVTSTYKDPLENWSDASSGAHKILTLAYSGLLRTYPVNTPCMEVVPVDLVISGVVAAAWDLQNSPRFPKVYNFVSSVDNPITSREFFNLVALQFEDFPSDKSYFTPNWKTRNENYQTYLRMTVYDYAVALFLDFKNLLNLRGPEFIKKVWYMHDTLLKMVYFTQNNWDFSNENVKRMWKRMSQDDKEIFNFDISQVNWLLYLRNYFWGLYRYVINPNDTKILSKL